MRRRSSPTQSLNDYSHAPRISEGPSTTGRRLRAFQSSSGTLKRRQLDLRWDQRLVYRFDLPIAPRAPPLTSDTGRGYKIEASRCQRWLRSYESWTMPPRRRPFDVSFLTGNPDELIKLVTIVPPADEAFLVHQESSQLQREHSTLFVCGCLNCVCPRPAWPRKTATWICWLATDTNLSAPATGRHWKEVSLPRPSNPREWLMQGVLAGRRDQLSWEEWQNSTPVFRYARKAAS